MLAIDLLFPVLDCTLEIVQGIVRVSQQIQDSQTSLAHYRTLALLDTGTADMTALLDGTEIIAQTLSLEQKIVPASLSWLENLLTGPWHSDRFLTVPPGGKIELSHMLDRP